jgi:hypothetical protein
MRVPGFLPLPNRVKIFIGLVIIGNICNANTKANPRPIFIELEDIMKLRSLRFLLAFIFICGSLFTSCSSDDDDDANDGNTGTDSGEPDGETPDGEAVDGAVPEDAETDSSAPDPVTIDCDPGKVAVSGECVDIKMPDLPDGWTKIEPGGDTICSRGTPFAFWVKPGTENKAMVYFQGGGACWDAFTCSVADSAADAVFSPTVDDEDDPTNKEGVLDEDDFENPFKDWYIIYIPYCSGDIHWGNNVMDYPPVGDYEAITIHHKGSANVASALEWLYQNLEAPDFTFVTGCSAGAYGAAMHSMHIINHYGEAPGTMLADSGTGVITDDFFFDSFPAWNAQSTVPDWIPGLGDMDIMDLTLPKAYIAGGNYYPDHIMAQYNTAFDWNQEFFYIAMGGKEEDWAPTMEAGIKEIADNTPNFRSYTAWGEVHCIMPGPFFYTYQVEGVRFRDWVADLASGQDVDSVHCVDCETEELYQE